MACSNCKGTKTFGVCKVCELVDDDKSIKEVYECVICNAWICEKCQSNIGNRWKAAVKSAKQKFNIILKSWNLK